jgi:alkanesulfonate monooxygenase SsuD/methylene tetrahydromethanopterin reductase-like flavin-dependent oxidoreductase (luciferase family)
MVPTCISEDGVSARQALRRFLFEPYLTLPYYQERLVASGFADAVEEIRARVAAGDLTAAAKAIPDEALDELTLAGTPKQARASLRRIVDAGGDLPVVYVFAPEADWFDAYSAAIDAFAPTPTRR